MSTSPPPPPLQVSRRLVPLELERVVSTSSQVSRISSADTGHATPASGMHRMASQRSVGSGMLPPLVGRQTSRRRLVSKRAIQERADFVILLFAAFWLCFNSGFVNVITLSSYLQLASTHVTGLVAKTSVAIGDGDWNYLYLPSTTFLCFLLGATAGGVFIRYETFYLGRAYGRSLCFIALLIGLALLIDKLHAPASTSYHYYVYMCAVAAGLQNSLTSKYSGNTIRTTHLTGATTDLGIALGHLIRGRWEDLWKVKLHTTSVIGFLGGGVAGRVAFKRYQETALLFNVTILFLLGVLHTLYVAFHEQLPVWAVIGTKKDIKIHRQASSVHILGPHHGPLASTSQGGPHPFGRARSALGVTSGGTRVRSALALERIDSSGIPGVRSGETPLTTSLSHGQLPRFFRGPSWLSRDRAAAAGDGSPSPRAIAGAGDGAGGTADTVLGPSPVPSPSAQAAAKAAALGAAAAGTPRMQSLRMQSLRDSGDCGGGSGGSLVDAHLIGRVGSPRARPLTEPETHRLIHVEVVEDVEGESDDDMDRGGDVDEYSVSDVAGEATDEDFDLIVDEVGDLVEFVPEEDGEGFAGEEREDVEVGGVSPVFHEAVEVAADGAAAVARDGSYESAEGGRTQAEDAV